MLHVNTRIVWLIILAILSYSNVVKVDGVTMYKNMAVFDILESILLQVGVTWKGSLILVRPS